MAKPSAPGVSAAGIPPSGDVATVVVTGTVAAAGPGKVFGAWGPLNVMFWAERQEPLTIAAVGDATGTVSSATNISQGDNINSSLLPAGTTVKSIAATTITFGFPTQCYPGTCSLAHAAITGLPASLDRSALVGSTINSPYFASGVTVLAVGPVPGAVQTSAPPTTAPTTNEPALFEFALTAKCVTAAGTDANSFFTGAATPWDASMQLERSTDGGATFLCCNVGGSGQLAQYVDLNVPVQVAFGEPERNVLYRWNCIDYGTNTGVALRYRISTTAPAGSTIAITQL